MKLPTSLNRKAIKQAFPRIREATWEGFFDNEKKNGLFALRVQGPDKYAYYDTEALMLWLVQRGLYRMFDFEQPGEVLYSRNSFPVRTHVMAG